MLRRETTHEIMCWYEGPVKIPNRSDWLALSVDGISRIDPENDG